MKTSGSESISGSRSVQIITDPDPVRLTKIYGSGTLVKNMDSEVSNVNEDKLCHEYIDMLQSSYRKYHRPSQNPTSNSLRGKATVSKQ